MKTTAFCLLALLCFAANSVLCRLALGADLIDAGSFTVVRLLSGALCLALLYFLFARRDTAHNRAGSWISAAALFIYALAFSYAYVSLDTGTGALILFGSVQITIVGWQYLRGKRPGNFELGGVIIAFSGLSYLVYPLLATPAFEGMLLMAIAGAAWGAYTLRGKSSTEPLADTTFNFIRTLPLAFIVALFVWPRLEITSAGLLYAVLSGAIASGVGYTLWYVALEKLSASLAAVSQLSVPVIAALGGVILVGETAEMRLLLATALVLGGIGMVIYQNKSR